MDGEMNYAEHLLDPEVIDLISPASGGATGGVPMAPPPGGWPKPQRKPWWQRRPHRPWFVYREWQEDDYSRATGPWVLCVDPTEWADWIRSLWRRR